MLYSHVEGSVLIPDRGVGFSPRMLWYGRGWGEFDLPLKMLSHDNEYTATVKKVLLTAFSRREYCLRNWEDEKRISNALTGLVDTEDLHRRVRKLSFQTNRVHGLRDPEGSNGVYPVIDHRLPWECISWRCSNALLIRPSSRRLRVWLPKKTICISLVTRAVSQHIDVSSDLCGAQVPMCSNK